VARAFKLVGLTGNIGSGKSTIGRMFAARGVPVIDADDLLREVQAPGQPAHAEIAAAWPEAVAPDGASTASAWAHRVRRPAARRRLEAITHPRIQELSRARAAALADAGTPLALYEASLLVESGRAQGAGRLIVVTASPATRLARVVARDGVREDDVRARMRAQLPQEDKVASPRTSSTTTAIWRRRKRRSIECSRSCDHEALNAAIVAARAARHAGRLPAGEEAAGDDPALSPRRRATLREGPGSDASA
jgi:dephospho-CoA kinase